MDTDEPALAEEAVDGELPSTSPICAAHVSASEAIYGSPPPPSSEHSFDYRAPSCGTITFLLLDDINTPEYIPVADMVSEAVPWHVEITFEVKNLPALLWGGLFFTEQNIDPDKGFVALFQGIDDHGRPTNFGFSHYRHYELIDKAGKGDGTPQWRGSLRVYAHDIRTLREFKPGRLGLENVRFVTAKDRNGREVYMFDSADADNCISAITDDAPLLGWWPWPKPESRGESMDGGEEESDRGS